MPSVPYIISGTIYLNNGLVAQLAEITFSINTSTQKITTDSSGVFAYNLDEMGYTSGDTVTYSVNDRFNNETITGSFVVSGANKSLSLTLVPRDYAIYPPGGKNFQIFSIGAKPISTKNPLPISFGETLRSHPDVYANVQTDLTYSDSTGIPSVETITFPDGRRYKRTFTKDAQNRVTRKTRWEPA